MCSPKSHSWCFSPFETEKAFSYFLAYIPYKNPLESTKFWGQLYQNRCRLFFCPDDLDIGSYWQRKMKLGVYSSYCPPGINLLYSVGTGNSASGGLGRWLRVWRKGRQVSGSWHAPPSWKKLLKSQIFTPNTVHLGRCFPEACLFIQSIQTAQESENRLERTLNLQLHVVLATPCLPSLEKATVRRWERAPWVLKPLSSGMPVHQLGSLARNRWHS